MILLVTSLLFLYGDFVSFQGEPGKNGAKGEPGARGERVSTKTTGLATQKTAE